jgi:hypothetical protein
MKTYGLAVVGAGLAGAVTATIAAENGLDVLVLEHGHGPKDRRNLVSGWLGCALYTMGRMEVGKMSDGALFDKAINMCREANGGKLELRSAREAIVSDELPLCSKGVPCYQPAPDCGREFGHRLYCRLLATGRADLLFGTEVERLEHDGRFVLHTKRGKLSSRRCVLATGSHSTEWIRGVGSSMGLETDNPHARLGVRVEMPSRRLRSFLRVMDDLRLVAGNGVLLDDFRIDSTIGDRDDGGFLSAFAHTLPGKGSERASFMASFDHGDDFGEAVRITKIVNILSNDKIKRERASDFTHGHSVLEHLGQFEPLRKTLRDLDRMVPSFLRRATVHIPEVRLGGALRTDERMKTAFPGLYGAGECVSRVNGLLDALVSAMVSAQSIVEDENG